MATKKSRTKNRANMVEITGSSAQELRGRGWSVFGVVDRVEGNIAWVRPTIPGDRLFGVPVRDLATHGRVNNPDPDRITSAAKRYERALEQQLRAIQEGRGVGDAKAEVRAAKRELSQALGAGVPITVVSGAVGAGLGAVVAGPVGAAAGAVAGGGLPTLMAAKRHTKKEASDEGSKTRRLKNRLMR